MIDDYLLDRHEIPVTEEGILAVPYPSIFLDEALSVRKSIPSEVFGRTVEQWHDDLSEIVADMEPCQRKGWYEDVFLINRPEVREEGSHQYHNHWEDLYKTDDQGFPTVLSISRNAGGTLFYSPDEYCRAYVFLDQSSTGLQLPEKKAKFLGYDSDCETNSITMHAFSQHNIDYLPGALFLRNWAVNTINEALMDLDAQGVTFEDYVLN